MIEWVIPFVAAVYWITRDDSAPKAKARAVPLPAPSAARALMEAGLTIGRGGQAVVHHDGLAEDD